MSANYWTPEKVFCQILWEAIGPDSMMEFPMPSDSEQVEEFRDMIQSILSNDTEELGKEVMKYSRPYLIKLITEDDTFHGYDLVQFLVRHEFDVSKIEDVSHVD